MANFNRKSDNELDRLTDEQLVEYIADARDAGHLDCAKRGIAILAFGHMDRVYYQVWVKIPREDVEDVTSIVIESAIRSAFDGKSVGEFVKWLKTITRRRIADYYRSREGDPAVGPLANDHGDEESIWGEEAVSEDQTGVVAIREAAGRLLEDRAPVHQMVIRLYGPQELGYLNLLAEETAARVNGSNPGEAMTPANVHQIWRRFKTDLDHALRMGGS